MLQYILKNFVKKRSWLIMFKRFRNRDFLNLEAHESHLAGVLVTPVIIVVFGILIMPLLFSLFVSFTDTRSVLPDSYHFVGFAQYIKAINNEDFRFSMVVTVIFVIATNFCKLTLGTMVALALKEKFKGRSIARSLIIIPWATPLIVTGVMWKWIYDPHVGLVNYLLNKLGIIDHYINILSNRYFAMPAIIVTDTWQGTPFFIILILAGLQTIPDDLYEAADIDGAGSFKKFFKITLPLVKFPMFVALILGSIFSINQFELAYVMTRGGPINYTRFITLYDWTHAFRNLNIGYASAVSYLILLLSFLIAAIYIIYLQKSQD